MLQPIGRGPVLHWAPLELWSTIILTVLLGKQNPLPQTVECPHCTCGGVEKLGTRGVGRLWDSLVVLS